MGYNIIMLVLWAELFRLSFYKHRIIHVLLSENPYPSDFTSPISYTTSTYNRIRIIHIHTDIKNTYLYPLNLDSGRIGAEDYLFHFHLYLPVHPSLCSGPTRCRFLNLCVLMCRYRSSVCPCV